MNIQEASSSNEKETIHATAEVSANVEELVNEIKSQGMSNQLWNDLCLAVANRTNGNAVDFRNDLIGHLKVIGFAYKGIFCHIGKNGAFYRNAWQGTYYYANVVASEYKCAAFLAY